MAVRIVFVFCVAVMLAGCAQNADEDVLVVFAAASLSNAFERIADDFEAQNPGVSVELNVAGSSSLREQVLAGAPADVVALANEATMASLVQAGDVGLPVLFTRNEIRLGVPSGNPANIEDLEQLAANPELFVGVCNDAVPCGATARVLLDEQNLDIEFDSEEPDARALVTKLEEGEFDAAFVYRSDLLDNALLDEVPLPQNRSVRTEYPIAVADMDNERALQFVDFVQSEPAQQVLETNGFSMVGDLS